MFSIWDKGAFSYTGAAANYFNEKIGNPVEQFVTTVLNFSPGIGDVKSGIEAVSGKDTVTGSHLSTTERLLSVLGAVPFFGTIGDVGKTIKVGDQAFILTDHALTRMGERNISPSQIVDTIKNNPAVEYFHDGVMKNGFRDATSKLFVGATQEAGKITTVITNTSRNYLSNLVTKGAGALSKLKQ